MKAEEPATVPQVEFENCMEALRRLTIVAEELQRSLELARNQDQYEARRNLVLCKEHIEDAEYRLNKAIKAMLKKL